MTEPNGAHFIQPGSSNQVEEPLAFCERSISAMTRKADEKNANRSGFTIWSLVRRWPRHFLLHLGQNGSRESLYRRLFR
jgi:hypothetical protein